MTRLILGLLVTLIVMPSAFAQSPEPTATLDFGDGWSVIATEARDDPFAEWQESTVYGGPNGARVTIWTAHLGHGIGWVGASWDALETFWATVATEQAGVASPTTQFLDHAGGGDTLPALVTDRLCVTGVRDTAVGLYGAYDLRAGIVVMVEGTVGGVTGVAATDYVAGLYFAALSA